MVGTIAGISHVRKKEQDRYLKLQSAAHVASTRLPIAAMCVSKHVSSYAMLQSYTIN